MSTTKSIAKFMRIRILAVIFLPMLWSGLMHGQNLIFDHYGLNEGLPQETIHCITKDKNGFIWLGTSDGVVRYDGHDFSVPLIDPESDIDISGYRIGAIQAKDENIYIGTGQNGLLVYNTIYETISEMGISDANCNRLLSYKNLLIASYYNKGIFIKDEFNYSYDDYLSDYPLKITGITALNDELVVGTEDGFVYSANLEQTIDSEMTLNYQRIAEFDAPINNLTTINNTLWVCTATGLFTREAGDSNFNAVEIINNQGAAVYDINDIVAHHGLFYLGTANSGLIVAAHEDNQFKIKEQFVADKKYDTNTVNSNGINDLFQDDNLLFIGNINLDITSLNIKDVFEQPTDKYNLDNPSVFAVIDTEDYLFIGTSSGLIISDNQNPNSYKLFPEHNRIRGFAKDADHNIWFVSNKGAYVIPLKDLNLLQPNFIEIPVSYKNEWALPDDNLRSVYQDRDNQIWIVSFNSGFSKFVGDIPSLDLKFENYSSEVFPSLFTLSMVQDENKNYWMTTQKGLSQFKIKNNQFELIKNYSEADGLSTKGVLSAFIDSSEQLWVASRKGINKYDPETDSFTSFGKRDGFTNTFVYNITEDDDNNLWLTTNGGLFRFNVSNEEFTNYNIKDGIQSTEFNLGAIFKNKANGKLYVGGIEGLNIFDPTRISELDQEGQLTFTDLKIKDQHVTPSASSSIEQSIVNSNRIHLDHDDFPTNLNFSSLAYRPNRNIQYVYKLLPDDQDWNTLEDKNSLQLLNLSPKTYTLQIQGKSRNSLWTKPPLEIEIHVSPPWYRSFLAYSIYLLLFLSVIYAFYRISLQRQIAGQESKRLKDLDDLKSRFITNITHEFRTPLTVILGYIANLKSQFSKSDDVKKSLVTIEQNSNNLLQLVNQMLDLAKLEQGKLTLNYTQSDIITYVKYITNSFSSIAEEKVITLSFKSELESLVMDFDTEKMRQILTNLISNALKFSPQNTTITVSVRQQDRYVNISVIDEGLGIAADQLPHIFDRFYQVENHEHKISQGTGIGLSLTKELVQLMDGDIQVTSEINKGTNFTVILPIQNTADKGSPIFQMNSPSIGDTYVPLIEDVITADDMNMVLIVEDNNDMARYIASCLQPHYKISYARNGQEGFDKAQSDIPDIIITDVMMPIMDGYELTKKLQSHMATNHIPIVMLTSKAMQEDKLEGIYSGADAFLTKPFHKEELLLRMKMLISKRAQLQINYNNSNNLKTLHKDKNSDKNTEFLKQIVALIHEHMDDPNFNAQQLSKSLAMSDSQLYRKLKAISNCSTAIFIRKVRLDQSKVLLSETDLTVSEIAYACGFNDPNWFSKAFKETFEVSPSTFRN
ncbi:MAG: response regulator [Algicola sp.]|nr:response regulator [Algicola sp.]